MPRQHRKQCERVRGYRIQYSMRVNNYYNLYTLPTIWRSESEGFPPIWKELKNNPYVISGRMFRSGRKCAEFRVSNPMGRVG